jgi:hypothetical protein
VTISGSDIINLNGLNVLTSIEGYLFVVENDTLTSLAGLDNMTFIGDGLYIYNNPTLNNLTGLDNVTFIGGGLDIFYNSALTCLTGLDNIDAGSIKNLSITSYPNLSKCEAQRVCDYLACPGGNIVIGCNAPGCNSQEEVSAARETISVEDVTPESWFSIYSNPASFQITIKTSTIPQKNTYLTLYDLNGRQLIKKQIMSETSVVDISSLPRGIYILKLTDDRTVRVTKLIKQ